MSRLSVWAAPVALFVLIFSAVFWLAPEPHVAGLAHLHAITADAENSNSPDASGGSVVWSHGRDGAARNAEEHWEKHGSDFPQYGSAEEYERGALDFVRHPPPGTLTKHRGNGDTLFYDPGTNSFAVADENGIPRTYFRPDSRREYWDRQDDR